MNEIIYGIGPYFPSITEVNWTDYRDWVAFPLDGLVPFDGDGHWFQCLDYRNNAKEPEITYIDTESDEQSPVAEDFAAYLSGLRPETKNRYVLETSYSLEETVAKLADALQIEFCPPDDNAHGYPVYAARSLGLFASPNRVPWGFVRKGHERYETLRHLMDKNALYHPEVSDTAVLLSINTGSRNPRAIARMKKSGMTVKPLSDYFT